jgi:hypothetical protein
VQAAAVGTGLAGDQHGVLTQQRVQVVLGLGEPVEGLGKLGQGRRGAGDGEAPCRSNSGQSIRFSGRLATTSSG